MVWPTATGDVVSFTGTGTTASYGFPFNRGFYVVVSINLDPDLVLAA